MALPHYGGPNLWFPQGLVPYKVIYNIKLTPNDYSPNYIGTDGNLYERFHYDEDSWTRGVADGEIIWHCNDYEGPHFTLNDKRTNYIEQFYELEKAYSRFKRKNKLNRVLKNN